MMTTHRKEGVVEWIGLRPEPRIDPIPVSKVTAVAGEGLEGDHFSNVGGNRQVTLIQHEHLLAVASILGVPAFDPRRTRRNIVVSGINLAGLKDGRFRVGEAVLEFSGECHPCSRMEENLGPGGYNAMRGHGGIIARVVEGGVIRLGDRVAALPSVTEQGTADGKGAHVLEPDASEAAGAIE
jgi:MOSC domain-containing protein YiiM